jgi:F420-non-reducing hydrogenase iron-sulfur subunit
MKKFEPTVIAFSCMFCAGCEPVAAKPEKSMKAAQLRVIRLHCLGKINSMHVLKAFESGADAVLVAGGACRFMEGLAVAQKQIEYTRKLLEELGIEPQRLELVPVNRTEGKTFNEAAEGIIKRVRALGPNPLMKTKKAA